MILNFRVSGLSVVSIAGVNIKGLSFGVAGWHVVSSAMFPVSNTNLKIKFGLNKGL
jgi:hypothetical protein